MHHRRRRVARDIVHRWEGNPLIRLEDLDFRCADIRNAAVATYQGKIIMLLCIENLAGFQSLHVGRLNENDAFTIDEEPCICPDSRPENIPHEAHGIMDARITFLEDTYYVMYVARGYHGFRLGLDRTKDFETFEHVGILSEPDTKAGALFPKEIKGKYARVSRPMDGGSIWVSYSNDLIHWGGSEVIITPRGGFWDESRVGIGPTPIETEEGWLLVYYGIKETSAGPLTRLGAAIVDREEPTRVKGRTNIPILSPREPYERMGDTPNIVFSTGAVLEEEGLLRVYYGAADSCICTGTTRIEEIFRMCMECEEEF